MIQVMRNNRIRPGIRWERLAAVAKSEAIQEKGTHSAKRSVYAHKEVQMNLEALYNGKCAYCETGLTRFDSEIEHFRPKGAVKERKDHPGYYWLAYEWENLYPSCTFCNQRRKPRPRLNENIENSTSGKGTNFPLFNEKTRAMKPEDDLKKENKLLIDPSVDNPEEFFAYKIDGQIYPINDNKIGKTTIKTFHLYESRLRDQRRNIISITVKFLEFRKSVRKKRDKDSIRFVEECLNKLKENASVYAGAARCVLRQPEDFGL